MNRLTTRFYLTAFHCALAFLLTTLLASFAFAQENQPNIVISPQSIVVNPKPSFEVDVFLNKDASGNGVPSYSIGENVRIGVRVSEDAYVYLFNVRSNGEVVQILPNRLDGGNNFVRAGQTTYFPPQNARYTFEVDGPTGLDKVIAVASKNPLDVSTLAQFESQSDFAVSHIGEESFAETLSIIVRPIPQESWVTDTTLFYVVRSGQPAPQPRFGTLMISSSPSGATVLVDGRFVGYTPVSYGTEAGSHTVRIELPGYSTFQTQVSLSGGRTVNINAQLSAVNRQGSLLVQANVGGAEVYVDGRYVGNIAGGSGRLWVNSLAPGSHSVRLVAPGYTPVQQTFRIQAGQTTTISVSLQGRSSGGTLMDRLGLSMYPGSSIRRLEQDDENLRLDFETGAGFEAVYRHFHNQLSAGGWQRVQYEIRGSATRAEAHYRRNGRELKLELDRRGRSGHYRLEIDLDDVDRDWDRDDEDD